MNDLTLGQYVENQSIIHDLDPRTKLMSLVLFLIILVYIHNPVYYLPLFVFIALIYFLAGIPINHILKSLRGLTLLLIFTVLLRAITTSGHVIQTFGSITITQEGLYNGFTFAARILLMVLSANIVTSTSTPKRLADGIEKTFSFLTKFGVNIHDLSTIVLIAFHFIPILSEEAVNIKDAQAARGVDFEHGSMLSKTKKIMALVIPLFMASLRRTSELALVLEARGYQQDIQSTKMHPLRYHMIDRIVQFIMIGGVILVILLQL